ncbi:MAG: TobH protein [Mycobacteriaceae bacterium]
MSAAHATVDLDDTDGLLEADRDGLLRSAAMSGAQVRATAAAVEEGALESLASDQRPRTVIWLAGRGPAEAAGAMLSAALGATAAEPIVTAAQVPPWIGPLDVLIVAGDDPGDPVLVSAAATAVRRGARVAIAAPYEGPLRDATAGRAAVLAPRLWVPDEFGLCRYLAAGLAALGAVDRGISTDLGTLADELDAEALRNSAVRQVFTNPAKVLAERISGRRAVLAGDCPGTLALARHGGAVLLRVGGHPIAATGLADALVALRGRTPRFADPVEALFHDEEIDGPLPGRPRVLALSLAEERPVLSARIAGIDDVDLVGVEDVGETGSVPAAGARSEQQLATLAVRLEMAAVYLRLAGG